MGNNFRFSQRQKDKTIHLCNTIQNSCGKISTIVRKKETIFLKFLLQGSNNRSAICFISLKVIFFQSTIKQNIIQIYLLPDLSHIQRTKLKCGIKHLSAAKYTEIKIFLVMQISLIMAISTGF